MTDHEKKRKKEARRLISLTEPPDNVHYKANSNYAHYMVQLGDIGVYFLYDGKRFYYLGEYPAGNWNNWGD